MQRRVPYAREIRQQQARGWKLDFPQGDFSKNSAQWQARERIPPKLFVRRSRRGRAQKREPTSPHANACPLNAAAVSGPELLEARLSASPSSSSALLPPSSSP